MATPTIKTTYALDLETVRALEDLARRWKVSRSEALRRAIRATATQAPRDAHRAALRALEDLQRSLGLDARTGALWEKTSRAERRAGARRREAEAK